MLRYIVNQGRTSKCNFISYYYHNSTIADGDSIKSNSLKKLREDIKRKAGEGRSRYVKYIEINPTLTKPNYIYDNYVHTTKLQKLTRLRTSCHSLAIEQGRHARTKKSKDMRLCHCNEVEDENHFVLKCHSYDNIRQQYVGNLPEIRLSDILQMDFAPDFIYKIEKQREIYNR